MYGAGYSCRTISLTQIVAPEIFNQLTTMHGLIMVFGAVMPAFVGLTLVGADDDRRTGHGFAQNE